MLQNIHPIDRALRIVLGAALLSLVFVGPHTAWGYLGVIPLLTGLVGYCPLYQVLGISTRRAHAGRAVRHATAKLPILPKLPIVPVLPPVDRADPPAFDIVVIAASAGGVTAVGDVLAALPADFPAPIVVVQHQSPRGPMLLAKVLSRRSRLPVRQILDEGEPIAPGAVYLARPDLHLVIAGRDRFALTDGRRISYVCSAADPLFESAASVFGPRVLAVVLTGAGRDATAGVRAVKAAGGTVIAQDEATSEFFAMPRSAIASGAVDHVLPLPEIAGAIVVLTAGIGADASHGGTARVE
jgi:two-component system chemotaxis response regulator CheB